MLKSMVDFADVIFPLDLRPLTYRIPGSTKATPGMLVSAEIKKSLKRGIILRPSAGPPPEGKAVKEIREAFGAPLLSAPMLNLIYWMSNYYFSTEGAVLKSVMPEELFRPSFARKRIDDAGALLEARGTPPEEIKTEAGTPVQAIRENIAAKGFKTFLLHSPTLGFEVSCLHDAIKNIRNVIILCPELREIEEIAGAIGEGKRLAVFHSGLKGKEHRRSLERILSGSADIVLGSRSALFAPLKKVSLIVVLREENIAYKAEGGVKYSARDMAVMRGYFESSTVLLSSVCPSVESYYNARAGKYTLIPVKSSLFKKPKVRLIDMRGRRARRRPRKETTYVSFKLRKAAERRISEGEPVMFLINRRGYSMLQCPDCSRLEACSACGIPLVYHMKGKKLRCRYCAMESVPPETCPSCGGLPIPVGAGVERIEEEARNIETAGGGLISVGTKKLIREPGRTGAFRLLGLINADAFLYDADFRSQERAFQDFIYAAGTVGPGGELIIQSHHPRSELFSYMRRFDFRGFYDKVLSERKGLLYPPFGRMLLLSSRGTICPGVFNKLRDSLKTGGQVTPLGPVQSLTRRGKKEWRMLLKGRTRNDLEAAALKGLIRNMAAQGIGIEADPISV